MKILNTISLVLLLGTGVYMPVNALAGGPGFKDDVKNWRDDDHWRDDDDHWNDDDTNEIPLDSGLSFLAVAGVAYGVKRIRDNRKDKKKENGPEA